MKILILYTYNQGYLSSFFHELSVKLFQDGYDVVNFSWKGKSSQLVIDNISITIKKKGTYWSNYYNILKLIKREKPDVILSNFSYANPSLLFGKIFGIKKNIVWFHSLNNQMSPSKTRIFIKKQFLRLADSVVANSNLTKMELREIYEIPQIKLDVIPFWTNISEQNLVFTKTKFIEDKDVLNIGCPGRLTAHKNQVIVLQTILKLEESGNTGFHLFFAGTGEDLSILKDLTIKFNLKDKVTFLGHLSAEDMVAFYKEMDVIILPSLDEAFGLVFIEALALGTPVIVSSKFGALTFIDQTRFDLSSFTFNPESAEDLMKKLIPYFNNSSISSSYFNTIYESVFDKEDIYKKVKTVLTTIK